MNLDVLGLEESLQNGLTYNTVLQVDELFYDTCKSAEFFSFHFTAFLLVIELWLKICHPITVVNEAYSIQIPWEPVLKK